MSKPKPYAFADRSELVSKLRSDNARLSKLYQLQETHDTLKDVAKESVKSNTYRGITGMPFPPSVFFRTWALEQLAHGDMIPTLERIYSQQEYDSWLGEFAERLSIAWESKMGKKIQYGKKMKLCNLLLRHLILWTQLKTEIRDRLSRFVHVPLDQFVLVAIRNCIDPDDQGRIKRIPQNATMSFPRDKDMYMRIQHNIRSIADEANVPTTFVDILAWHDRHPDWEHSRIVKTSF
jgi:hypothetical protein